MLIKNRNAEWKKRLENDPQNGKSGNNKQKQVNKNWYSNQTKKPSTSKKNFPCFKDFFPQKTLKNQQLKKNTDLLQGGPLPVSYKWSYKHTTVIGRGQPFKSSLVLSDSSFGRFGWEIFTTKITKEPKQTSRKDRVDRPPQSAHIFSRALRNHNGVFQGCERIMVGGFLPPI